jgi:hypothetical protein
MHTTFWSSQKMTSAKFVSTIALTGILSLSSGLALTSGAIAAPDQPVTNQQLKQSPSERRQSKRFPTFLANAVRRDLARQLGINTSKVRVIASERTTWPDSCLGLPGGDELCSFVQVDGWKITLSANNQQWIYRTDLEGRIVRPEKPVNQSAVPDKAVIDAVMQAASQQLQTPIANLKLGQSEQETWSDGCLGLGGTAESCLAAMVPGWQVRVESGSQRLVYRTNLSGSAIRFDEAASYIKSAALPNSVARSVLQAASRQTGLRTTDLRITQSKSIVTDGCLGLPAPGESCIEIGLNAWQVTVAAKDQQLVYRSDEQGKQIRFDQRASQIGRSNSLEPTIMASQEIPPSLSEGVVFRAIVTGGITGSTTQTMLMSDGRLVTLKPDPKVKESTQQQVRRLSRKEVSQFVQLLQDQQFDQFDRLNYPAPQGAADYMVVTLTSGSGTTRYVDMVQEQLPKPLQSIVQAWNRMAN